jgi:hypothetical protein
MGFRERALALGVCVAASVLVAIPARADPSGSCNLGQKLSCQGQQPGGSPGSPTGTGSGTPPSRSQRPPGTSGGGSGSCNCTYIRKYTGITFETSGGVTVPIPAPGFCTDPATGQRGVPYQDYRVDLSTGQQTLVGSGCEVPGTPPPGQAPSEQAAAAAGPPPAPQQVWKEVPLPAPSLSVNPATGLTGLATWLWTVGFGPVAVNLPTIGGYTVSASAHPVTYRWIMGDGTVETSAGPGSVSAPAVAHTYQTKGDYTIVVEIVWGGSYTAQAAGAAAQTFDLGTTSRRSSTPYHVIEIRSVLDQSGGSGSGG